MPKRRRRHLWFEMRRAPRRRRLKQEDRVRGVLVDVREGAGRALPFYFDAVIAAECGNPKAIDAEGAEKSRGGR